MVDLQILKLPLSCQWTILSYVGPSAAETQQIDKLLDRLEEALEELDEVQEEYYEEALEKVQEGALWDKVEAIGFQLLKMLPLEEVAMSFTQLWVAYHSMGGQRKIPRPFVQYIEGFIPNYEGTMLAALANSEIEASDDDSE